LRERCVSGREVAVPNPCPRISIIRHGIVGFTGLSTRPRPAVPEVDARSRYEQTTAARAHSCPSSAAYRRLRPQPLSGHRPVGRLRRASRRGGCGRPKSRSRWYGESPAARLALMCSRGRAGRCSRSRLPVGVLPGMDSTLICHPSPVPTLHASCQGPGAARTRQRATRGVRFRASQNQGLLAACVPGWDSPTGAPDARGRACPPPGPPSH